MKKTKTTRILATILAVSFCAGQLDVVWPAMLAHAEETSTSDYSVEHNIISVWEGGCSAEIVLTNFSTAGSQNWSLSFCSYDKILDIWGGRVTECVEVPEYAHIDDFSSPSLDKADSYDESESENESGVISEEVSLEENSLNDDATDDVITTHFKYTIIPDEYNKAIPAGASVKIGYNADGSDHGIWDDKAILVFNSSEAGNEDDEENENDYADRLYVGEGYTIETIVTDSWDGAYNVKLLITNTGNETLHNWAFMMRTEDTISGLYNAVELSNNEGMRLIKNAAYNQDIPIGATVEVGYTAYYDEKTDLPDEFALSHIIKEVDISECEVSLFSSDEWENGGIAQIIITNTSESAIEDWMIEFDSEMDIVELWGGAIESHEGNHYFIRNPEYAQNILAGDSCIIGILFDGRYADIRNVTTRKIVADDLNTNSSFLSISKDHMVLNEEKYYELDDSFAYFSGKLTRTDGVTSFTMQVYDQDDILIYLTDILPEENWMVYDFTLICGKNRVVFEVDYDTESYSDEILIDCKKDYYFDKLYLDPDTDGDGISDYEEYLLEELNASFDSLTGTYTATFSADDMGIGYDKAVVPSVTLTGDAEAILNFSIEMVDDTFLLNPTMVGYMGKAYELSTRGNMIGAELTFTYDKSMIDADLLDSNGFIPAIFCFDPDNKSLVEIENQTRNENMVTVHLEHFSTYLLANSFELNEFWNEPQDDFLLDDFFDGIWDFGEPYSPKSKLIINVTDIDGNAVPYADVRICHMNKYYLNAMGGIFNESVDTNTFLAKTKTDTDGKLECYLNAQSSTYNGCYVILVDKDGKSGNSASTGQMKWPESYFIGGLAEGQEKNINIVLEPYSDKSKVEFQVRSNRQGEGILYSSNIRLYKGWNLTDFSNPAYQYTAPAKGWCTEVSGIEVPKGCYTAEIEKAGYTNKYIEILVTSNNRPFLAVMDQEDNVVEVDAMTIDKNCDGIDDKLTEYLCKGLITTYTGTTVFAEMRNDPAWEEIYKVVMSNDDKDGDCLKNGEEIVFYSIGDTLYFDIISNPDLDDSDGDGIDDKNDPHPLMIEEETVNLSNIFSGIDYLNVEGSNGGKQAWWGSFSNIDEGHEAWTELMKQMLYDKSEGYRISCWGCGLIAMTDLEIYLTQQNNGYHLVDHSINYDMSSGNISQYEYMQCVNYNEDHVYHLRPNALNYYVGVTPFDMESGIEKYLEENGSLYCNAKWASTNNKTKTISVIETMISNNLPVVFSYHDPDDPLGMYGSVENAKKDFNTIYNARDHYMTIIGYTKYLNDNGKDYSYVLKVESWGNIYYISYDQYADKISYVTNILEIF